MPEVCVFMGPALADYHFGEQHPFGPRRYGAFADELQRSGLISRVRSQPTAVASVEQIERFHRHDYVERVRAQSQSGTGYLDCGDTPARAGIYEAAATVVGTTLAALDAIVSGHCERAFVPIAGLHHARADAAAGFCVFNDCAVAIETLRRVHGIQRVAYVDIDAHHGDGVFYAYDSDPNVFVADLHEDGNYLYPGTGRREERGCGAAAGTKLNIPMAPGADDAAFFSAWEQVEAFLAEHPPEFILLQCGADSLAGDPITHLRYSEAAHAHAARRLRSIADVCCHGRLLAMGGGGYSLKNLARAWSAVVAAMAETP